MKKVYVVGQHKHYADFIYNHKMVNNIEEADIVIFTGGEDVTPELYGAKPHYTTYSNYHRDMYELQMFKQIRNDQLVVGVCRGSQFGSVVNGGLLVQNCNNHGIAGTHEIIHLKTGDKYQITSTHHQMQYPYNLNDEDYTLIAVSNPNRSSFYEGDLIDENIIKEKGEPEIVLYHKKDMPKYLAIQGHPEYMNREMEVVKFINKIIDYEIN